MLEVNCTDIKPHGLDSEPRRRRLAPLLCVIMLAAATAPRGAVAGSATSEIRDAACAVDVLCGFTSPFRTVTLAAVDAGRIKDIPIDEGDCVKAGDVAVLLDDSVQQQRVKIAEALALSILEIELARVESVQLLWELEQLEKLNNDSYTSVNELTQARAAANSAKLALKQAEFKHEQACREHVLQQALLDELTLKAPFAGYISERMKEIGDTVEEREGVLTLVRLDPLVVALDCPIELVSQVRAGRPVLVQPVADGALPRAGEISFISKVADPASQTFKVKILIPNSDRAWMAGMRVKVDFEQSPLARNVDDAREAEGSAAEDDSASAPRPHELTVGKR